MGFDGSKKRRKYIPTEQKRERRPSMQTEETDTEEMFHE